MKKYLILLVVIGFEISCSDNKSTVDTGKEKFISGMNNILNDSVQLDQGALLKQFLGSWECKFDDSTSGSLEFVPLGTGIEGNYKIFSSGKLQTQGKQIWGYEKDMHKIIGVQMFEGLDIQVAAMWFTSESDFEMYYLKELDNLSAASFRLTGKFRSPDELVETIYNKEGAVRTDTWKRRKAEG